MSDSKINFKLICTEKMRLSNDSPIQNCQLRREHLGPHKFETAFGGMWMKIEWMAVECEEKS